MLAGKDKNGWKTAQAKVYPPLLSRLIMESHMEHAEQVVREGHTVIPDDIMPAIAALSSIHDPYLDVNQMQSDHHRDKIRWR